MWRLMSEVVAVAAATVITATATKAAPVSAAANVRTQVSDGLVGDTTHICEQSSLGALIAVDRVPVDPALRAEFGAEALQMAIAGGEDYELLAATPEPLDYAVIGRCEEGTGVEIRLGGSPVTLTGWDHFGGRGSVDLR